MREHVAAHLWGFWAGVLFFIAGIGYGYGWAWTKVSGKPYRGRPAERWHVLSVMLPAVGGLVLLVLSIYGYK